MKVVIGANSLQGQLTGIGYYTKGLIESLAIRQEIEDLRLLSHGRLSRPLDFGASVGQYRLDNRSQAPLGSYFGIPAKARLIASRVNPLVTVYDKISSAAARYSLRNYSPSDIFHGPDFQFASFPGKTVVTIPDLSTITFPEFHPAARVAYVNRHIRRVVDSADHIVTISEFVRREIIVRLGVCEQRVTTIYPGVDTDIRPISLEEFKESKIKMPVMYGNYFIFVSTIEPRKNISRLLTAYRHYRDSEGASALPLLVVGNPGWDSTEIHKDLTLLAGENSVICPGYVDRKVLRFLIAGAKALLFPSIYEGFGLPVVEAMRSGTAVLTSINSAMSEVAGSAALLVDPSDPLSIFDSILRLHRDEKMVRRLEAEGLKLSSRFTWEKCSIETVRLYKSLTSGSI